MYISKKFMQQPQTELANIAAGHDAKFGKLSMRRASHSRHRFDGQRVNPVHFIAKRHDRNTVRLLEIARYFRERLPARYSDRSTEAEFLIDRFLNCLRHGKRIGPAVLNMREFEKRLVQT